MYTAEKSILEFDIRTTFVTHDKNKSMEVTITTYVSFPKKIIYSSTLYVFHSCLLNISNEKKRKKNIYI